MILYENDNQNPNFNLALEEVICRNFIEGTFYFWQNKSAVIVGRNQIIASEVNLKIAQKHDIPIIRRMTGGGAVFHDLGVLNFSFIYTKEVQKKILIKLLKISLAKCGLEIITSSRNDFLFESHKIIGTASAIINNKFLFHGSILFNANVELMMQLLTPSMDKLLKNGVTSIKNRVKNISEFNSSTIIMQDFINNMYTQLELNFNLETKRISNDILQKSINLAKKKYVNNVWNYEGLER